MPALHYIPAGAGTDHHHLQLGLTLIRRKNVNGFAVAALRALDLNARHGGIEDVGGVGHDLA